MSRKVRISRRTFLGGAAVTVSLPFLEAMIPTLRSARAASEFPTRLVFVHVPNGMIRTNLRPREAGAGYTMPAGLEALADLRGEFNILTGLSNRPAQGRYTYSDGTVSDDGPGDHARDTGTFLTATRIKKTSGDDYENGISVDQVAANYLREVTPSIPSLELGTKTGSSGGDSGYGPIYKANISWSGPTTPVPKETDPRAVFDRLFAGIDPAATAAERDRRRRLEQSVLDYCIEDIQRLQRELGSRDQQKLDEYLTGVRHLEVRLDSEDLGAVCDPGSPPGDTTDFRTTTDQMYELIKLAFQCDRTRVVSLMLEKQNSVYDFLGLSEAHHRISHLENGTSDAAKIESINSWQLESFGNLLRKLKGATEDDGSTLLDNSLVLFGGGLDGTGHDSSDDSLTPRTSGSVHRHTNLPLFLGGRGGGAVTSGRHVVFTEEKPIADLYVTMLHSIGATVDGFGLEGTAPLAELA